LKPSTVPVFLLCWLAVVEAVLLFLVYLLGPFICKRPSPSTASAACAGEAPCCCCADRLSS
jgi:hypothetical protein